MALPSDPKKLYYGAYDQYGTDLTKAKAPVVSGIPPQLQDNPETQEQYSIEF